MRSLLTMLVTLLFCMNAHSQTTDVVIVVHKSSESVSLSHNQIKNLFMGGVVEKDLNPIALARGNLARAVFNTRILGLTESRIQSYWAQMRFGGRQSSPIELKDPNAVIKYLTEHPNAIGYLPANMIIPDDLLVIYSTSKTITR